MLYYTVLEGRKDGIGVFSSLSFEATKNLVENLARGMVIGTSDDGGHVSS